MKKLFFFYCVIAIILTACGGQEKRIAELQQSINIAKDLLDKASAEPQEDFETLFGFKLNGTIKDFQERTNDLIKNGDGRLDSTGDFIINTDWAYFEKRDISITPYYKNDSIVFLDYYFVGSKEDVGFGYYPLQLINEELLKEFDETWENVSFDFKEITSKESYSLPTNVWGRHYSNFWVKGSVAVELTYGWGANITYYNVPSYYKQNNFYTLSERLQKDMDEAVEKLNAKKSKVKMPKVENSPWNGSVRQVERYVKNHLKDPKSYESIEWSPVVQEGSQYRVRHRFRAKNSFGGYTVEDWEFCLDLNGNVIDVKQF